MEAFILKGVLHFRFEAAKRYLLFLLQVRMACGAIAAPARVHFTL